MSEHDDDARQRPGGGTWGMVVALGLSVLLSAVLSAVIVSDYQSGDEDAIYNWLLVGLITVIGLLLGLVALVVALVRYGRAHSGGRTALVTLASLATLGIGGYLIVQVAVLTAG